MQTFLPALSYSESARLLDNKRLGKQRVECLQILQIIGRKQGWLPNPDNKRGFWNHPAVRMWESNPHGLVAYTRIICEQWIHRGFQDTVLPKVNALVKLLPSIGGLYPSWYNHEFIRSHRSNLIRKDPEFYGPKFPGVPNNLPYIWPV